MNIKRISILAFAALAALILPLSAMAYYTETVSDYFSSITWTYTVINGQASIYYNHIGESMPGGLAGASPAISTSTAGPIEIPSTLGGYPVTSIGTYAFYGCSQLWSVTIPDSVTTIWDWAFKGCSTMTTVEIPSSVTSIGKGAFESCDYLSTRINVTDMASWVVNWATKSINSNLRGERRIFANGVEVTNLVIPDSVTSIVDGAFSDCSGLKSVTIPDSVTCIGDRAFAGCNLTETRINVSNMARCAANWATKSINSKLGGTRRFFANGAEITNLPIPSSVTSIGDYAFYNCSGLTSVTIPNSVTSIGDYAFKNCSSLKTVTIPNSVTSIGDGAFSGCSGLTSVTIPNSVTSIGDGAFSGCSGLTSVTIPNSVTSIGDGAFSGCSGIRSAVVPGCFWLSSIFPKAYSSITKVSVANGSTSIGDYAFQNCQSLRSLKIPNSVESIGSGVFSGCDSRLFDTASLPGVKLVDGWCVGWYTGLSGAVNLKGARGIAGGAFYDNREITSVTIPETVKSIGDSAFYGCSGLKSVTIGNGVKSIGSSAFEDCYDLTAVTIGNGVKSIGSSAFEDCYDLTAVTIPNSVTSIGSEVFYCCSRITSVVIPSSVKNVSDNAFDGSHLDKIYIHKDFPGNIANNLWGAPSHCLAIFYTRIFVFDQQDGTGERLYVPVSSATTPASVTRPKRTGYVFTGYWTGPKGTGTKIYGATGKKVRNWSGGESAILYAGWTKSKFKIVFKANGGKGKMAKQTVTYGKAAKLIANKFTRKGWLFRGWAKSKSGAVVYKNKASIKGLASETNIALYAVWAKKTYKVKFYANGGKGKMKVEKFTYGKAKKLSANKFKRKGYTFKGWAKSKALAKKGKVAYRNKQKVKNLVTNGKTVKLYAVWKKK